MSMSVVFSVLLSPHYMYHKPHVMQYGSQPVFIDINLGRELNKDTEVFL